MKRMTTDGNRCMKKRIFVVAALVMFSAESIPASRKIARYMDPSGAVHYGIVEGETLRELNGGFTEIADGACATNKTVPLRSVKLLPPVEPTKIINFGWTYPAHAREVGGDANRPEPLVFLKPPSCLIADRDTIRSPELSGQVEFEGELAIVIGKKARNLRPEEAMDCVLGYTVFNDVTARDLTKKDIQFTRGKGFDTFGPLGPWIVTDVNPEQLRITTRLNGEVRQSGTISEMHFSIPFLISYISKVMTLVPGDVLATGTPSGSAPMKPGDVVQVEIDRIGTLTNFVR